MKKTFKIIGKITLWSIAICLLTMINVIITEIIFRASYSPFYMIGPLPFCVTLVEVSLIYLLFFVLKNKDINERRKRFIYYLATLCIMYGFIQLFSNRYLLRYAFAYAPRFYKSFSQFLMITVFSIVYNFFIPTMAVVGGGLLFKFKEWGRRIIIDIGIVIYFFGLFAAIGQCVYTVAYMPYAEKIMEQFLKNKNTMVAHISYWPTYLISLLALLLIFYFTRPKVKEMFK